MTSNEYSAIEGIAFCSVALFFVGVLHFCLCFLALEITMWLLEITKNSQFKVKLIMCIQILPAKDIETQLRQKQKV